MDSEWWHLHPLSTNGNHYTRYKAIDNQTFGIRLLDLVFPTSSLLRAMKLMALYHLKAAEEARITANSLLLIL